MYLYLFIKEKTLYYAKFLRGILDSLNDILLEFNKYKIYIIKIHINLIGDFA